MKFTGTRGGRESASSGEPNVQRFNSFLVDAILESVDFGLFVLRFFEHSASIKRGEIARNPQLLSSALCDLFGDSASWIENKIIHALYAKLGMEFVEREGCTFSDYVKNALVKCYPKKD